MYISNFWGSFLLFFDNILDSGIIKFPKYICMIFIFCLLTLLIGEKSYSAEDCDSQNEKPKVKVDVYLVKETTVCPGGYRSYRDKADSGKRCGEPIKYDQLKELSYLGVSLAKSVPPEKIPLDEISNRLSEYNTYDCPLEKPCEDPNKRWSIVLAFDFQIQDPKGKTVSLQRKVPESIIGDYFKEFSKKKVNVKVEDTLDFGGKWLHHQRADLFLPGHKVKWILTAGSYCWTFGTKFVKHKADE